MKYFEKQAGAGLVLKGIAKGLLDKEQAVARVGKLHKRKLSLMSLEHANPDKFYTKKVQDKLHFYSKTLVGSNLAINRMKVGAAPVHPMQGTMLNVQTRESQRKYKSKILGKKRADILVPLWS